MKKKIDNLSLYPNTYHLSENGDSDIDIPDIREPNQSPRAPQTPSPSFPDRENI